MIDQSVKSTGYRSAPLTVNLTQTCFKPPTPLSSELEVESFPRKNIRHFHCKSASRPSSRVRCRWSVWGSWSIPEKEPRRHWESIQTLHHPAGLGWSPSNPELLPPDLRDSTARRHRPRERWKKKPISTGFPTKITCINKRFGSVTSLALLIRGDGSWWIMGTECHVIITGHFRVRGRTSWWP